MQAPRGELALVFTDIEGSTGLWERLGGTFSRALAVHNAVMRSVAGRFEGYEVKTEGDSFMLAFPDARSALTFCLEAQRALHEAAWPAELLSSASPGFRGVRVRMGLHVGAPECRVDPLTGRMDYLGPVVNRAARVSSAAHGGQVLLSGAARAAVGALTGEGVERSLGVHRLRGLSGTEELIEVLPVEFAGRSFAPPRTEETRRSNLRASAQPLLGREVELRTLAARLEAGERLMTVLGPGGIGKSRLILSYASDWLGQGAARSAWWVAMDACTDEDAAVSAIAAALDLSLPPGCRSDEALASLAGALRHLARALAGPVLLVADGVDQAIGAIGPLLAGLVGLVPELRVLVSSRERLRVRGEGTLELGPLTIDAGVALFLEIASEQPADTATVRAIVERLDGIPLAIELAARRLDMLDADALLRRLGLDLLTGGSRDAAARQRTLRATIEWSWRLLQPHEQRALAWCSVFAGSFTPDAAEEVLQLPPGSPPALDVLQDLRDKSLLRVVRCDEFPGERRLSMFSSVREWCAEQLDRAGERAMAMARYQARVLRALVPLATPFISQHSQREMLRLWVEREHLTAVNLYSRERDPQLSVQTALALAPILGLRGPVSALMPMLDHAVEEAEPGLRPMALIARGNLLREQGRLDEAKRDLLAARAAARGTPEDSMQTWTGGPAPAERDPRAETYLQAAIGSLYLSRGQVRQAEEVYAAAQRAAERLNDRSLWAIILANRGAAAIHSGRFDEARTHLEEALRTERALGLARAEAVALTNLATLYVYQRRPDAERLLREAEGAHLALGDLNAAATTLTQIGLFRFDQEDPAAAQRTFAEALERFRAAGQRRGEGMCLAQMGRMDRLLGDDARAEARWREALALMGEVRALRLSGYVEASLGALLADRGEIEAGRALIEAGAARLQEVGDPLGERTAEICRAHLDRAEGAVDGGAARVQAALHGEPPPLEQSIDLRVAKRIWEVTARG